VEKVITLAEALKRIEELENENASLNSVLNNLLVPFYWPNPKSPFF
jgi:hypothetical protein